MQQEDRKCENCGGKMPRAAYIPFNGGMIICFSCHDEWENSGEPKSIADYHQAVYQRENHRADKSAEK